MALDAACGLFAAASPGVLAAGIIDSDDSLGVFGTLEDAQPGDWQPIGGSDYDDDRLERAA